MPQKLETRPSADAETFEVWSVNDDPWTTRKEFKVADGLSLERAQSVVAGDATFGERMTTLFEQTPAPEHGGYDELFKA
jgi:hypothetical protein